MRRAILMFSLVASWTLAAGAGEVVVPGGRTFRVADGFEVELVAGPPRVDRPIVADFDELGRLYVADSSGSNASVSQQVVERPHRIVRLEDSDGDGRFDRSTVFADRMMFPEGAMWLDGSLYVAAPPSIWKLTDVDGDGVAERREEWFQGKTLTHCANDLHGPYAGLDGRIYWCKGAFASQTYDRPGKPPLVTRAAHIFRARRDGTGIEPVMTGGMDNPVELVFTPEGERIFDTTFFQHPAGGRRDGLVHALYGGVYGKVHDVIDGHPRTGPDVLPPMTHLGPAAPSGLARLESDALGTDFRGNLVTACFNLRKVTRHVLRNEGGSLATTDHDLVVSDDFDFHPTDVLEDADGSLLVVDTGGWYKLCCPTSQLVKPDVLGGIYRIRRKGAPRPVDPRGLQLDWARAKPEELAGRLADPRPAVRDRARELLGRGDAAAMAALTRMFTQESNPRVRQDILWSACRSELIEASRLIRLGLADPDDRVRQTATQAVAVRRDREALPQLMSNLQSASLPLRRVSAEAIGRVGDAWAVPALLSAAGATADLATTHSLTYALIEIGDARATLAWQGFPQPSAQRAALVAIDQMAGGKLEVDAVLPLLASSDESLAEAAWWVAGHHPEWGKDVAGRFRYQLELPDNVTPSGRLLEGRLARFVSDAQVANELSGLFDHERKSAAKLKILRALASSRLKELPRDWAASLARALGDPDELVRRQAVATSRAFALQDPSAKPALEALRKLADDVHQPSDIRLAALAASPDRSDPPGPELFTFLISQTSPDRPVSARLQAVDVLTRSRLSEAQSLALAGVLAQAGPVEAGRLLEAFDRAEGEAVGLTLVEALKRSPARASFRVETLRPRLARFGAGTLARAEPLFAAIEAETLDRRSRFEALLSQVSGGDIRRGQAVFNSPKAACASCHAIGYVGGKLGPDLTKVGQIREVRDLLESIVEPSASFVRGYEPVAVATRDGKVVSGLLRKDSEDEVVVAVSSDRDERIPRSDVEEIRAGTVSVMPAGLDRQLSPAELADLVAFLKACR